MCMPESFLTVMANTACQDILTITAKKVSYAYMIIVEFISRGSWKHFNRDENILLMIAFFCWVYHMTLNSHITEKKDWDCLKSIDTNFDSTSCKHHNNKL